MWLCDVTEALMNTEGWEKFSSESKGYFYEDLSNVIRTSSFQLKLKILSWCQSKLLVVWKFLAVGYKRVDEHVDKCRAKTQGNV